MGLLNQKGGAFQPIFRFILKNPILEPVANP